MAKLSKLTQCLYPTKNYIFIVGYSINKKLYNRIREKLAGVFVKYLYVDVFWFGIVGV